MSFPSYPSHRNSGSEWIGLVPIHWDITPIKIVTSCNDDVLDESTRADRVIDYIEISDVSAVGGVLGATSMTFGAAPSRARRLVKHGDVIISTVRTYLRAIAAIKTPPETLVVSTGFAVFRPTNIDPGYLSYVFQAEFVIAEIISCSVGVSYPAINAKDIGNIRIPMPNSGEQLAIAAFLDSETTKIDALISDMERLIALFEESRQAMISHAVTQGIQSDIVFKESGIDWIGRIPHHWLIKRLKKVAVVQGGITKGRDLGGRKTISVPYLRVANVQDGYIDLTEIASIEIGEDELQRYLLQPGDVLLNEGGDYDKLGRGQVWDGAISPCIHQNHVFAVRPHSIEPEWLALISTSAYGRHFFKMRANQSTNLASISSSNLRELPVICPPANERVAIIQAVAERNASTEAAVSELTRYRSTLLERRHSLILAAVTGKIDVRGFAEMTPDAQAEAA